MTMKQGAKMSAKVTDLRMTQGSPPFGTVEIGNSKAGFSTHDAKRHAKVTCLLSGAPSKLCLYPLRGEEAVPYEAKGRMLDAVVEYYR